MSMAMMSLIQSDSEYECYPISPDPNSAPDALVDEVVAPTATMPNISTSASTRKRQPPAWMRSGEYELWISSDHLMSGGMDIICPDDLCWLHQSMLFATSDNIVVRVLSETCVKR